MATKLDSIDDIIKGIRDSNYALTTESRLAGAGLKVEQDIASVMERFAWLYNLDTVRQAEDAYRSESDPEGRERLRRVYYHLLDGYLERQTAEREDAIASFEIGAIVEVDGKTIPYYDVPVVLAGEPDYEARDRLWEASLAVVEQTNPDRLDIVGTQLAILDEKLEYGDYTAFNSEKKRLDYGLLNSCLENLLSKTADTYTQLMGEWIEDTTGRKLGEVGSHHFSYVTRMSRYDAYFEKDALLGAYERTLVGLGFDPNAQANIHLDTADRPTKDPRPCCYVADPPEEVHLIVKPVGGFPDYVELLHEAGHAQHYGNVDPALGYPDRALPTSYALSETYAFLMESLAKNPVWLREVVGLPEETSLNVANYAQLADFALLRRCAADLRYELAFFEDPLNEERNRELYAATHSTATGFLYPPQNYLNDMDPGYYSADYLRAMIAESVLQRHLEEAYGEGWFDHPEAGSYLRGLWASGENPESEDLARMLGYEALDTALLERRFLDLRAPDP